MTNLDGVQGPSFGETDIFSRFYDDDDDERGGWLEAWDVMVANNLFGFMAIILVLVQVALFNTGVSSVHEFMCFRVPTYLRVVAAGTSWEVMGDSSSCFLIVHHS